MMKSASLRSERLNERYRDFATVTASWLASARTLYRFRLRKQFCYLRFAFKQWVAGRQRFGQAPSFARQAAEREWSKGIDGIQVI
jgi:hypothetical protein